MDMRIEAHALSGTIAAIASKSEAHRALIAAALSDRPTKMILNTSSRDIAATRDCLSALGAVMTKLPDGLLVAPIAGVKKGALLDCVESGSTARFLLPVVAALGASSTLTGRGRLPERPLSPLNTELIRHGAALSDSRLPLQVSGQLTGGTYTLPGNVSSQYITGLLFALPLLEEDSTILLTTSLESATYVDMTIDVLKKFGVSIDAAENGWKIKGGQRYHSPETFQVCGDWSNAAFWLASGALHGQVGCTGLNEQSLQSDRAILSVLKSMGAGILSNENEILVKSAALHGVSVSVKDCPDLLPVLAVVAAFADGTTTFMDAARLRIKECDRLHAMRVTLEKLGVACEEAEDRLIVHGGVKANHPTIDGFSDHRIVMSAAIALSLCGGGTIRGAEAVEKSYPTFFSDFAALGGIAHVI